MTRFALALLVALCLPARASAQDKAPEPGDSWPALAATPVGSCKSVEETCRQDGHHKRLQDTELGPFVTIRIAAKSAQ